MSFNEQQVVSIVTKRLYKEMLYELQTGGGVGFDGLHSDDAQRRTIASIQATVTEMKMLFAHAPQRVADHVAKPNQRVLDVGAGRAPWSVSIARAATDVHVTAIDLPEQIPALQLAVNEEANLGDRFTIIGIDLFGDDWFQRLETNSYDLILVANVCHLFDAFGNQELLRRVLPLLRDDGALAIIDQVLEEYPDWPRWAALYALGVLHCAPGGHLFAVREFADWLSECGSWNVHACSIAPLPPLTLILARRTLS